MWPPGVRSTDFTQIAHFWPVLMDDFQKARVAREHGAPVNSPIISRHHKVDICASDGPIGHDLIPLEVVAIIRWITRIVNADAIKPLFIPVEVPALI